MTDTADSTALTGFFRDHDVHSLATDLRRGHITSIELVEHSLDAIARIDPVLNAFTAVDAEGARDAARRADDELAAGHDRGALHGIPVAVKDLVDVAGHVTTRGSKAHPGPATTDAECVRRLRAAGAVIVGKNVLHEFAFGATGDRSAHGASRNPWDPNRISGGSSGGSAVATAAGMVPLAVGTDTAGSVRVPAALCGVVGFKPAFGAIPTNGVQPLAASLDHIGVFARTSAGAAAAYAAMSGRSPIPIAATSIGWVDPACLGPCDPAIVTAGRETLRDVNVAIDDTIGLPFRAGEVFEALSVLQSGEAYTEYAAEAAEHASDIDPEVLGRLLRGRDTPAWQYVRADRERARLRRATDDLLERFDVLAMPTAPTVATEIDQRSHEIDGHVVEVRSALLSLTCPWNLTGHPALSVPAGMVSGLPVGLQLITAPGREGMLFSLAERIGNR